MYHLCTDFVNPRLKSIYFAIHNQLKVGNYHFLEQTNDEHVPDSPAIPDEKKLLKKSVESLIVLWHEAHQNDRYKAYYDTVVVPNYFIFPSDYESTVSLLKDIDFNELLVLISPVTTRESLSDEERDRLDHG
jgi:hypothetical protein